MATRYDVNYHVRADVNDFLNNMSKVDKKLSDLGNKGKTSLDQLTKSNNSFSEGMKKTSARLYSAGKVMEPLSRGVRKFTGAIVKSGMESEKAFVDIRKTTNLTEDGYKKLDKAIRTQAKSSIVAYKDVAKYAEIAGQMGFDTAESISGFATVLSKLEVASDLAGEAGAHMVAKYLNIMYDKDAKRLPQTYKEFGDTVTNLGNKFSTTESQIVEMATRIAPTAKLMKYTSKQTLALSTALSASGIKAQEGAGAIQRLNRDMSLAVGEGGKKLEKFAQVSGKTSKQFADDWREDPLTALADLSKGINQAVESGENIFEVLADLGIKNTRDAKTLALLASKYDLLADAIDETGASAKNALDIEHENKMSALSSQVERFKNNMADMAKVIFDKVAPILTKALGKINDKLSEFSDKLEDVSPAVIIFVGVLLLIIGIMAPLLLTLAGFAMAISLISDGLQLLGLKSLFSKDGLGKLGGAFKGLGAKILGFAKSAGTALQGFFLGMGKGFQSIGKFIQNLPKLISGAFSSLIGFFKNIPTLLSGAFSSLIGFFKNIPALLSGAFTSFMTFIKTLPATFSSALAPVQTALTSFVLNPIGAIRTAFSSLGGALSSAFASPLVVLAVVVGAIVAMWNASERFRDSILGAFDSMKKGFNSVIEDIQPAFDGIKQSFEDFKLSISGLVESLQPLFDAFMALAGILGDFLAPIITSIFENIGALFGTLVNIIMTLLQTFLDVFTTILEGISLFIDSVKMFFEGLFAGDLPMMLEGLKGIFASVFGTLLLAVGQFVSGALKSLGQFASGAIKALGTAVTGMIEAILRLVGVSDETIESVKTAFTDGFAAIGDFVGGILAGIGDWISGLVDKAKELLNIGGGGEKGGGEGGGGAKRAISNMLYDAMLSMTPGQIQGHGSQVVNNTWNIQQSRPLDASTISKLYNRGGSVQW